MIRDGLNSVWKAGLVSLSITLLYLSLIRPFSILEIPELKTQDFFFRLRHLLPYRSEALKRISLIAIDDETLEKMRERWPFKRRVYAKLLDQLEAAKPKLTAFDFVFSGKGEPADDWLLSEAIRKAGNVVLASFVDSSGNYIQPIGEIGRFAKGSGAVNKLLDRDLYVRRSNLSYSDASGKIAAWPWEVEIWRELEGLEPAQPKKGTGRDLMPVPFFSAKIARINFRFNLNDVRSTPLWKALGSFRDRSFEESEDLSLTGKIVLIGAASRALHDDYHTPLGLMPGVVVNANFLVNLLTGDFLISIPLPIQAAVFFLFTFLASFLSFRYDVFRSLTALSLAAAGYAVFFFLLFLRNYLSDYLSPVLGGWAAFLSITFYRYFFTFLENAGLRQKVITDPLTGLYNRRFLETKIDDELAQTAGARTARKTDAPDELSILMIDIDDFKKINDAYGHQFGDDALKNVSFSIQQEIREPAFAARFGGEEFCVVLPRTAKEEAARIAERIRKSVAEKKISYINQITRFTVSVGAASSREDRLPNSRALIRAADRALYHAKQIGKNRVCLYDPTD